MLRAVLSARCRCSLTSKPIFFEQGFVQSAKHTVNNSFASPSEQYTENIPSHSLYGAKLRGIFFKRRCYLTQGWDDIQTEGRSLRVADGSLYTEDGPHYERLTTTERTVWWNCGLSPVFIRKYKNQNKALQCIWGYCADLYCDTSPKIRDCGSICTHTHDWIYHVPEPHPTVV